MVVSVANSPGAKAPAGTAISTVRITAITATGRQRRDGRWPSGNSRSRSASAPQGNTNEMTQLSNQSAQTRLDSRMRDKRIPGELIGHPCTAEMMAMRENSQPMTFRGCRDATSAPRLRS